MTLLLLQADTGKVIYHIELTLVYTDLPQNLCQGTYEELRKLAALKLAHEKPGQTLQATALVHEAYIRLVDAEKAQHWNSRGHFFAAAADAMRRILVENARRKGRLKRGGQLRRINLDKANLATEVPPEDLLAVDDATGSIEALGRQLSGRGYAMIENFNIVGEDT